MFFQKRITESFYLYSRRKCSLFLLMKRQFLPSLFLSFFVLLFSSTYAQRTSSFGSVYTFEDTTTNSVRSARLSDDKAIIVYKNGISSSTSGIGIKAVVATVDSATKSTSYGSDVFIEDQILAFVDIVALSSTKAVVLYERNLATDLVYYRVLDIDGSTITVGSAGLVGSGTERAWLASLRGAALTEEQIVVCREKDNGSMDSLIVVAGTVSGTTISWGSEVRIAQNVSYTGICRMNDTKFAMVYEYNDGTSGADGVAVIGTVSGNTISLGSPSTFHSSSEVATVDVTALSETELVIAYEDDGAGTDPTKVFYATVFWYDHILPRK